MVMVMGEPVLTREGLAMVELVVLALLGVDTWGGGEGEG